MNKSQNTNRLKNGYHFQKPIVRFFFRAMDFFGNIIIKPFLNRKLPANTKPRKILLCKNDHLGDLVLFLSVLPEIREAFKNDELHLVVGSWSKELAEKNPYINKVIYYDGFFLNRSKPFITRIIICFKSMLLFLIHSLKTKYDIAIDFRAYFPNMIPILFFSNISYRIGFSTGGFGFLLNSSTAWKENVSEVNHFLDLINLFEKVKGESNKNSLEYLADYKKTHKLLNYFHFDRSKKFILVHPFGGDKTKHLEKETWVKLIRYFKKLGLCVFLIGQAKANPFLFLIDNQNIFDLINKTDIHSLSGLINEAEFLVGMDSFPAQLSLGLNKKTIVIITGIENDTVWYKKSDNLLIIKNIVTCSPCYKKAGCKEMKCMNVNITETIDKIGTFITRGPKT
jgi:ADP-heptose:LPS heptosyltransferase